MNRRDFIAGTAATVAVTGATVAQAEKAAPPPSNASSDLAAAVQACLQAAYACREHCIASLSTGDKMMAACMRTVTDMIPLCEAVAQLSASKSKHLKKAVGACLDACIECEAECKKHASMSEVCKRAGEACAACIAACKKV